MCVCVRENLSFINDFTLSSLFSYPVLEISAEIMSAAHFRYSLHNVRCTVAAHCARCILPQLLLVVDRWRRLCVKFRLDNHLLAELSNFHCDYEPRRCHGLLNPMQYVSVKHKSDLNVCYSRRRLLSRRPI